MPITKTVKCKILKEDFTKDVNYMDCHNCPISKALHRAGIEGYHASIDNIVTNPGAHNMSIIGHIPKDLSSKVYCMCKYANGKREEGYMEPADIEFEATLII